MFHVMTDSSRRWADLGIGAGMPEATARAAQDRVTAIFLGTAPADGQLTASPRRRTQRPQRLPRGVLLAVPRRPRGSLIVDLASQDV